MIKTTFQTMLKEEIESMYTIGHYPTSDEAESHAVPFQNKEHGCLIELTDGTLIHCIVIPLAPKITYGAITKTGEKFETFPLTSQVSHYFSKFKKKIDSIFDAGFLDEDQAKSDFNVYLTKLKTGK